MTKSINEAVARLKTIFNRCSNDYFKGLRSGSEVEAEFEAAVRTELAQPAPPMSGRAADLAHVWETIYDHGAGKHKGAASLAQRQKAIEILERMEQAVQPVIAQPKKPFPAPGRWFPIGVLDHPMREYMPGKWESAEWPSDYVPDREQPAQPMSGRAAASIKSGPPLQDAKDAERLTFMVSRPPRYVESSKNGFYRVYQDHAADSDEHALWVAMTLDYYTSANGAIDAAIASQKGSIMSTPNLLLDIIQAVPDIGDKNAREITIARMAFAAGQNNTKDTKRLDWWIRKSPGICTINDNLICIAWLDGEVVLSVEGATVRKAIDAAIASPQGGV